MENQTTKSPSEMELTEEQKKGIFDQARLQVFPIWLLGSSQGGITKREYFAGLALMGLMDWDCKPDPVEAADYAVRYAEALMTRLGY